MYKICIFAGTTEGRELVEFLAGQPVAVTACVATEYGETLLPEAANVAVLTGRLTEREILTMLAGSRFDLVVDATHPYAVAITESLKEACRTTGTEYLRLLRRASDVAPDAIYAADADAAVDFLKSTTGNILLTTGSKDLAKFARLSGFSERVYARVLPVQASLEACHQAGLSGAHILAMQGPFSEEMNLAMLQHASASFLVTKDGGEPGGFDAKISAAKTANARVIVIGRPTEAEGYSYGDTVRMISERFGLAGADVADGDAERVGLAGADVADESAGRPEAKAADSPDTFDQPSVKIVGIGPGSSNAMTVEVLDAIRQADCMIGAKRMLEAAQAAVQCGDGAATNKAAAESPHALHASLNEAVAPSEIADYIHSHTEYRRFVVLMSGDAGFFSGAKKLLPMLKDLRVDVLTGVSSLAYLCAKLQTSYEDVVPVSLHGRARDIAPDVRAHGRVFALVGGEGGINSLCRALVDAGLGNVRVSIGERLSYPDEKITVGTAATLADGEFAPLSAALIENEAADRAVAAGAAAALGGATAIAAAAADSLSAAAPHEASATCAVITPGLPDSAFLRGAGESGIVPMTKSEVRAVCLSKLALTARSVCWDIGAGTGSVAIEMALLSKNGQVYAIERNPAAVALLRENAARFPVQNLKVIEGSAPEICADLPAPTHVFIGGSSGNMRGIIQLLLVRNPSVRIVATAVSLETVAELSACAKELPFAETEVVSVQVARGKKAGDYTMMKGFNPVYVFTMQGRRADAMKRSGADTMQGRGTEL